jgi:hypothetical protein
MEHAFTGEKTSTVHTIETADEFIPLPDLDTVGMSTAVQFGVAGDDLR